MHNEFTAIVEFDGKWYVAYCPEIPGANGQGSTRDEALASLREAVELFYECASQTEIAAREGGDIYITQLEVSLG